MSSDTSLFMYDISVPVFSRMLKASAHVLRKGEEDAAARGIDPGVFLAARLAPDMLPLIAQIRIATDHAKGACYRLAGREVPKLADEEKNFAELQARIEATRDLLKALKREEFDGAAGREIVLRFPGREIKFGGLDYLTGFAMGNFHFHLTTAYDILRHNGVKLGKSDYFGG
jgi:hypothetical protein